MLIRLTKSNHSAQFFLLILLALAFWVRNFVVYAPIEIVEPQTFLYHALFGWTEQNIVLAKILAFVCVFLQAFWLNEVVRTHSLSKNPIFVGLIYIVLMSAQSDWQIMQPFLISNFFIIGGFAYLFKIYDRKEPYEFVFSASLLFALAALFSMSLLPFVSIVFLVFLSYSIHKWREWLIALLGFAFPCFVLFLWASLSGNLNVFSEFSVPIMDFNSFESVCDASLSTHIFRGSVLLISLVGMGFMRVHSKDNEISQRKKISTMTLGVFWLLIITLLTSYSLVNLATLFIFFAFFMAEWFYRTERHRLSELVFYIFLAVSLVALYV